MAVKFGGHKTDYSAMQGPAPSGFHVPLNTEWQAVVNIWTALGGGSSDGTNFGIALKLPVAGQRSYSSASATAQGTYGLYWSSSHSIANYAYNLYFYSSALYPQYDGYCARAYSVRCFKDEPTIPTSSWTKLYGTSIEAGGIFWSSADGLISLSSDGQTWITIADKNLGATTVWNSGDTLSEANCGKYYQRGNNYGFPRTGTVTTSGAQVDASNYGPGNYYSSSTFIIGSYRWDSTDNGNLRGGVTGIKPGDLRAAYIGEWYVVPTSISLDKNSVSLTTVGQTAQITATILPATAKQTVTWTSSNTSVATVDQTGLVTCVTPGDATITATTVNGLTATCTVKETTILDFTTQDVLTFKYRQNSYTGYGWTSGSGYYSAVQSSSYYRTNTTWQMPDSVFGGTLDMIKLELQVPNLYSGGGITRNASLSTNSAGMGLGCWDANSTNRMSFEGSYSSYTYTTGIQTLVMDFVNDKIYVEGGSTPLAIGSARISNYRSSWNSKTLYLNVVANQTWATTYLRKVEIITS